MRSEGTHFGAVLRAIIYQQLSGKAAATIHGRVAAIYDGRVPSPALLLATADSELRSAGLSRQKLDYLRSLAGHCSDGSIPLARLSRLPDDEIIERLTEVRGVGRWTAQMFLMSRLGRLDVLPDLDLGIQRGLQIAYALPAMPKPVEVLRMGEHWRPYRSVASWYMWRVADGDVAL